MTQKIEIPDELASHQGLRILEIPKNHTTNSLAHPFDLSSNIDSNIDNSTAKKIWNIKDFLNLFGGETQAFRTFNDKKKSSGKKYYGTLADLKHQLEAINKKGHGVYFTPNRTDGVDQSDSNVVGVRAVWVDLDGSPLQPLLDANLPCHAITETSPSRFHGYWLVTGVSVGEFCGIQKALAEKFHSDKSVSNPGRVMRLPGFYHHKGKPFLSGIHTLNPDFPVYEKAEIISAFNLVIEPSENDIPVTKRLTSSNILDCLYNHEDGDREIFVSLFQDKFCYDHAEDDWYSWTGNYWQLDEVGDVFEAIGDIANTYYVEAKNQADLRIKANRDGRTEKENQHAKNEAKLLKRATSLQFLGKKRNIIFLAARGNNSLGITGREWDKNLWILPLENGVVELQTGDFRQGELSDYVKSVAPHEWQGINAPCPTWDKFINDIIVTEDFNPDPETVDYLQRLLGYAITGLRCEHVFPIFWGDRGRNGKGTLFETLSYVLGPLAGKVASETLLQSKNVAAAGAPSPHLMALRGKRLCFASETEQNRRLNVNLIKELAGGDSITARSPFGKRTVQFEPTHTLFLMTNNKPVVRVKTIDPIWDRIALIPFHLKYVDADAVKESYERPRDLSLSDKLKAEAPGILAWLVRGCLAWQQSGLKKSEIVQKATAEYKNDEDIIGQFIEEKCVTGDGLKAKASDLQTAYSSWCDEQNIRYNKTAFGRDMGTRYATQGEKRHKIYLGIGVISETVTLDLNQQ